MQRSFLVALGVVCVLVGVFVLARLVDDPSRARVAAAPMPSDALPTRVPTRALAAPERAVRPPPSAASAPLAPSFDGRAAVAEEVEDGAELVLLLTELGTSQPVAGADVWLRWRSAEEGDDIEWDLGQVDAFQGGAVRLRADGLGRVQSIVPLAAVLYVVATRDDLFGRALFETPETPETPETSDDAREHALELTLDWDLVVEVRDHGNRPLAGFPVALTQRESRHSRTVITHDTRAPDGTLTFPHLGHRIARSDATWSVAPLLLLAGDRRTELRENLGREPPPGPIVFRLPPHGAVEVVALELDGTPVPDGTEVQIGVVDPDGPRELSPFNHSEREQLYEETTDGSAVFEHIGLGHELEAVVARSGSNVVTKVYGSGPFVAGERAVITVRVGAGSPVLLVRAVDERRRPFASTEIELRFSVRSSFTTNQWSQTVTTDGDGLFRADAPDRSRDEALHVLGRIDTEGGLLLAQLTFDTNLSPGLNDLGQLVFAPPPLLVAGRVEDPTGGPVVGAEIHLRVRFSTADRGERWFRWREDEALATDEQGEFAIHSLTTGEELLLSAEHEGKRGNAVRASIGEIGVRLLLHDVGLVRGTLLLDPEIPLDELAVRLVQLESTGARPDHEQVETSHPEEDGAFSFDALVPGLYDLDVQSSGGRSSMVTIAGLRVPSGAPCRDARLERIDLRGLLHVHRLVFHSPDPGADLQGNIQYSEAGAGGNPIWLYFQEHEVAIVTPHEVIDLTVTANGYRGIQLDGFSGTRELELSAGIPVRLVLRTEGTLPEPPIYLKAVLVPADGSQAGIDWGAPTFDETREIKTKAFAAGKMKVLWILERRSGASALATTASVSPDQFVEVQDRAGEQTFEVEISAAELARILEEEI